MYIGLNFRIKTLTTHYYFRTTEIVTLSPPHQGVCRELSLLPEDVDDIQEYAMGYDRQFQSNYADNGAKWSEDFSTRVGARELLRVLQTGDGILVNKLQSIFSSCDDAVKTIALLKQRKVQLHIVEFGGDVTDSRLVVYFGKIAAAFSALEKRRSAERIKGVKQSQKDKGRYLGGSRPFGYMIHDNGRLIENPMEQRMLKKIISLKRQGKSLRDISRQVSTPMMPISFKTVHRLLQRQSAYSNQATAQA